MRVFRCIKEFEVPYKDAGGTEKALQVLPGTAFTAGDDSPGNRVALSGILLEMTGRISVSCAALQEYFEELT